MKDEQKITARQQKILDFIRGEIREKGYAPSVREICAAVGLKSTSSVHAHLNTLEQKGYITKDASRSRTLVVVGEEELQKETNDIVSIPILGTVAAGVPIYAEQNIDGYFPMKVEDMPRGELFMLKIKGDSMINVGIYDGDLIVVKRQNVAQNGEIVVALVEDSATVKTYYKEADHVRLQPENDSMDPIIVKEVSILGKLAGLYRRY